MATEKTVQYGPLTPQELDSFVRELQLKNIPFEIQKDEEAEKKFKSNNFSNLVTQAEYRTEQYLGQIFYVTLATKDIPRISETLGRLGFPTELPEFPKELETDEREDIFVRAKSSQQKFKKQMVAWILLIGVLSSMFIAYAFHVLNQP